MNRLSPANCWLRQLLAAPSLMLLLLLLALSLSCGGGAVANAGEPADEERVAMLKEPFLKSLFAGRPKQLAQLTSCLDSVFKLGQAYEALYRLKTIYSDHLSNSTSKLTDLDQKLLLFCQQLVLPVGGSHGNYFRHPVNAHKFVLFAVRAMNPKLHELVEENAGVAILLRHLLSNTDCWLNEASVTESMQNLLTIKQFYNISVADFASGNFAGHTPEAGGFTVQELLEFLLHLNRQFDPAQVAELAEFLRRERSQELRSLGEQPVRSVYRILGKAYYQMKQFDKAMEVLREYRTAAPADANSRSVEADLSYIAANQLGTPGDFDQETRRALSGLERDFGLAAAPAETLAEARWRFRRYRGLCGGATDDAAAASRSKNPLLICENWRPLNGWFVIRKEIVSVAPMIVYYRDVFTGTNLTEELMLETEKRIFESPPDEPAATQSHNHLTKVRLHSFKVPEPPFDSNVTQSIIRRLEFATGMDVNVHFASSEKYIEMENHGHGIRNQPHLAASLPPMFYDGMATAVFFPVEQVLGGEMLFPDTGVKIPVKRSDVILWYSYLPTFHQDKSAVHNACPIMFGNKWTARVTLGLTSCSLDQEVMMEPWLPGRTLARRRSVARNWTVLARPKRQSPLTAADGLQKNDSSANATDSLLDSANTTADNATAATQHPDDAAEDDAAEDKQEAAEPDAGSSSEARQQLNVTEAASEAPPDGEEVVESSDADADEKLEEGDGDSGPTTD